jgi:hypothetical protein
MQELQQDEELPKHHDAPEKSAIKEPVMNFNSDNIKMPISF